MDLGNVYEKKKLTPFELNVGTRNDFVFISNDFVILTCNNKNLKM